MSRCQSCPCTKCGKEVKNRCALKVLFIGSVKASSPVRASGAGTGRTGEKDRATGSRTVSGTHGVLEGRELAGGERDLVPEEGVSVARVSGSGEATGSMEVKKRAAGEGGWSSKVEKKAKTREG